MPINVTVDVRERALIALMGEDAAIKTAQLALGDIEITYSVEEGGATKTIYIERKTVADLLSSIKDGRYEEQSFRLMNEVGGHTHDVIYLIEGATPSVEHDRTILFSAMFSLTYYKGFGVVRVGSLAETAFFIQNTVKRIDKNNRDRKYPLYGYFSGEGAAAAAVEGSDKADKEYVAVAVSGTSKKVKRDNITVNNINELMLCTIPGISAKTAGLLIGRYGSIENMILELRERGGAEAINGADGVHGDRKISKAVVASVNRFLLSGHNIDSTEAV